jgi:hypothetical protein
MYPPDYMRILLYFAGLYVAADAVEIAVKVWKAAGRG